ncbi:MAG: hypothetical protein HY365_02765 [Candidatus Aenigmarchaeota archaeon]|nr:hypothetical protein [Candidatus Aenigmarchaeota archaeon]
MTEAHAAWRETIMNAPVYKSSRIHRAVLPLLIASSALISDSSGWVREEEIYRAHPCYQAVQTLKEYTREYAGIAGQECRNLALLERSEYIASEILKRALQEMR